jgi:hypothetical protein
MRFQMLAVWHYMDRKYMRLRELRKHPRTETDRLYKCVWAWIKERTLYRCDFQVHTPCDRQWAGPACVTDDERTAYANDLVEACRAKGLNAIAIVFPGIELTLAVPCQAS